MSGAASGPRRNSTMWVQLDSLGNVVPGSNIYKPRGIRPHNGNWKQISDDYCCGAGPCTITFTNNATVTTVTSIVSADNALDTNTTLLTGDVYTFVIPNCYDESITLTFSLIGGAGVDISGRVVQGNGDIGVSSSYLPNGPAGATTTITTTATPGSQYLVNLTDD